MGGPKSTKDVNHFLTRLFFDREIINLPFQKRTPKIEKQYLEIGGGSPITYWTEMQGKRMVDILDKLSPKTAPHNFYVGFRYVHPLIESTINEMERDGVERAIAFSQYPQYSCTTSGSSFNALVRHYGSNVGTFTGVENVESPNLKNNQVGPIWSFIDRWPTNSYFVSAFSNLIRAEIDLIDDPKERQSTVLLFSAHSIPMSVVNRGDSYPQEVAATVHAVMEKLNFDWSYRLVWQSKVGPVPWLGPSTESVLHGLSRLGYRHAILIPIAFTSDHIETLYEMDIEYCSEVASQCGMTSVRRVKSLNDNPLFIEGLATMVLNHINSRQPCSKQFWLRCPMCTNRSCGETRQFIESQKDRLTEYGNTISRV